MGLCCLRGLRRRFPDAHSIQLACRSLARALSSWFPFQMPAPSFSLAPSIPVSPLPAPCALCPSSL
eukprot:4099805-Pleurochrysis_carterae.AAC.1